MTLSSSASTAAPERKTLSSAALYIHIDALTYRRYTCAGKFGSLGYEEIDAKTYASWGIDYLKYDNCYNEGRAGTPMISYERYNNMSMALNATGRPMVYSLCNWGEDGPWNFASVSGKPQATRDSS